MRRHFNKQRCQQFYVQIVPLRMPGPAGSEGVRQPTNPAIRVQFSARSKIRNVEKGFFAPVAIYCATYLRNHTQQNS